MKNKKRIIAIITLLVIIALGLQSLLVFASEPIVTLRHGSRGNEVVRLQQALKTRGYFNGNTTGYYGPITERSVINFQRDHRLIVDGIAGIQTQTALYGGNSTLVLRHGSRGREVTRLQEALKYRGYFTANVTGYFGPITERAVINFQRDFGLIVDGIAGRQTQNALYASKAQTNSTVSRSTAGRFSNDDVFWLARIIHAEAWGEPYRGKVAVGNVVINRVNSRDFPNSIYGVIFEYYKSIPQFSPVADGTIYNRPCDECFSAAREAIGGSRPVGNSTYFFNPDKAAGTWIVRNKSYVTRIGGHVFYQ